MTLSNLRKCVCVSVQSKRKRQKKNKKPVWTLVVLNLCWWLESFSFLSHLSFLSTVTLYIRPVANLSVACLVPDFSTDLHTRKFWILPLNKIINELNKQVKPTKTTHCSFTLDTKQDTYIICSLKAKTIHWPDKWICDISLILKPGSIWVCCVPNYILHEVEPGAG